MSGHIDYHTLSQNNCKSIQICYVPVIKITKNNLNELDGYCSIVEDYSKTNVINVTWPKLEGRPLYENTGNQSLPTEGIFEFNYKDNYCFATNHCVPDGKYTTGFITKSNDTNNTYICTAEANYHPCGGQIIYPYQEEQIPFIILLSKTGDNIKPSDFVAFHCDGTFGIQILPHVWHQPAFPMKNNSKFHNKQCSVHACVIVNTINEFNTLLQIDITDIHTDIM